MTEWEMLHSIKSTCETTASAVIELHTQAIKTDLAMVKIDRRLGAAEADIRELKTRKPRLPPDTHYKNAGDSGLHSIVPKEDIALYIDAKHDAESWRALRAASWKIVIGIAMLAATSACIYGYAAITSAHAQAERSQHVP